MKKKIDKRQLWWESEWIHSNAVWFPYLERQSAAVESPEAATELINYGLYEQYDSIVQELCESRGGRPGLSVLTSLLVSVDVKLY